MTRMSAKFPFKATGFGFGSLLFSAGLLLAPTAQAQAFSRSMPLLTEVTSPAQGGLTRTSMALAGGSLFFSDTNLGQVFRCSLADLSTTHLAGLGGYGDRLDPNSALNTQLFNPQAVCPLRDGSILVADNDNHRVLRLRPNEHGEPMTVTVFAGTQDGVEVLATDAPEETEINRVVSIIEARNGSVLLLDQDNRRVLRVQDGTISVVHGTDAEDQGPLAELTHPCDLLELRDGSMLIADQRKGIIRIDPAGVVTAFASHVQAEAEYLLSAPNAIGLALAPDGSVLLLDHCAEGARILRLHNGLVTLRAGYNNDDYPLDPQCFESPLPPPVPGPMVAFGDGSILMPTQAGITWLSPDDHPQGLLTGLVEHGKAAITEGDRESYRVVKELLALIPKKSRRILSQVSKDGQNNRLQAGDQAVISDLMQLVHAYVDVPGEAHRTQLALRELKVFAEEHGFEN